MDQDNITNQNHPEGTHSSLHVPPPGPSSRHKCLPPTNEQVVYALQIIYTIMIHITKLSILNFYLQFFPFTVFPRMRTAIYATMAFTVAMCLSFSMAVTFQCTPVDSYWNKFNENISPAEMATWTCIDLSAYGYAGSALQIALDLWLMALPMPELLRLSLPIRKKLAVCFMFAVGSL